MLGAALAVTLIALATGGLHLDGLADTADGLGSRRPADQALEIMRRSDAGPLGVATLVLVLLVQVSALASLPGGWAGAAGLVLAAVTSRVAVVLATGSPLGPAVRVRRPGGRADQRRGPGGQRGGAAGRGGRGRAGPGRGGAAARGAAARGGGPGRGRPAPLAARRRLGGMTGDVFGAVIELSTATVLLVLVLAS